MSKVVERHELKSGLHLYRQANSRVWLVRIKVGRSWISRTTKQTELEAARQAAYELNAEMQVMHKHGVPVQSRTFKQVALLAVQRMDETPVGAKGRSSFIDYKQILSRYHIPFFDRHTMASIDRKMLLEFDEWRTKLAKRLLSQSTLKSHNAAMQRVFDEAVIRNWMSAAQVPVLSAADGATGQRRDYFTPEEVKIITAAFPAWVKEGRKQVTRDIRELLFFYFQFAIFTGLRPGTEIDNLKWSDIQIVGKETDRYIIINVRKGKTTLYTGTRKVVAYGQVLELVLDMSARSHDGEDSKDGVPNNWDPLVFRLPNGDVSDQLGRNFSMLLKKLKLENGPGGKRTLYSLRHTYITMKLLEGNKPEVIAKQCGTSTAMIDTFYNHLTSLMYTKELIGNAGGEMNKLVGQYSDIL